jgi:hypothetical protein
MQKNGHKGVQWNAKSLLELCRRGQRGSEEDKLSKNRGDCYMKSWMQGWTNCRVRNSTVLGLVIKMQYYMIYSCYIYRKAQQL